MGFGRSEIGRKVETEADSPVFPQWDRNKKTRRIKDKC